MKWSINIIADKIKCTDNARLRIRVHWKGMSVAYNLGRVVCLKKWNTDCQRCKANTMHNDVSAMSINRDIEQNIAIIDKIFRSFDIEGIIPSKEQVKTAIEEGRNGSHNATKTPFSVVMDIFIRSEEGSKMWTLSTVSGFLAIKKKWLEFCHNDIAIEDFNKEIFNDFRAFLISGKLNNTTIKNYLSKIKWLLKWCIQNNYTIPQDVLNCDTDIKTIKDAVVFLTFEELRQLKNATIPTHMKLTRDIFLFCCYTSLRYSDASNLKWADVNGNKITIVTRKTNTTIVIELTPQAQTILETYKGNEEYVFKAPNLTTYNRYIRECCKMAGIDTLVNQHAYIGTKKVERTYPKWNLITSHSARRTFISNALQLGIPVEIVKKWTGHHNYDSILPYIGVSDNARAKAMEIIAKNIP